MSLQTRTKHTVTLSHTTALVITAMFMALVYVFTLLGFTLAILPGTYVHLGNIPLFMAAALFGRKVGMVSGGVGMALFDIMSPYAAWAPFTLVVGALMGYVIGWIAETHEGFGWYLFSAVLAIAIKVGGYYIADGIIYGNWIMPVYSIPANVLQVVVGAVAVLAILRPLKMAARRVFRQPVARPSDHV